MALSHQRIRFCNEYIVDLNATNAAVRAGYSPSRAAGTAYDLMQHPEVKAEIEDLLDARLARTRLTADRVLRELARLAFFDSRKLFREDGSPIPINELDSDTAAAIATIRNLALSGEWGYVLRLPAIYSMSQFKEKVIRAGGEILERFRLARGKANDDAISGLAMDRFGRTIGDTAK